MHSEAVLLTRAHEAILANYLKYIHFPLFFEGFHYCVTVVIYTDNLSISDMKL